jgi:hypothetical protein
METQQFEILEKLDTELLRCACFAQSWRTLWNGFVVVELSVCQILWELKVKHRKREKGHSWMCDQLSGSVMLQPIELTFKRNLQYFQHGKELIGLCWFYVVLKVFSFVLGMKSHEVLVAHTRRGTMHWLLVHMDKALWSNGPYSMYATRLCGFQSYVFTLWCVKVSNNFKLGSILSCNHKKYGTNVNFLRIISMKLLPKRDQLQVLI